MKVMATLIAFCLFLITFVSGTIEKNTVPNTVCLLYKNGPSLDTNGLVGSWMTVYTQPKSVKCFNLHIRAITDLEREQCMVKYGNFSNRIDWDTCLLEVVSPEGKHYLQGDGTLSGLLENIIIIESSKGNYSLQDQTADQWTIYGRRGSELLLMRDCAGEIAAMFARIPYWPTPGELYAVLHRSGIAAAAQQVRQFCGPINKPTRKCSQIIDGDDRVTDVTGDQALDQEQPSSMEDSRVNGRKPL